MSTELYLPNLSDIDIVIYHGNCPDGLAGAWCFWTKFNNRHMFERNENDMKIEVIDTSSSMEVTSIEPELKSDSSKFYAGKHETGDYDNLCRKFDLTAKNIVFVDFSYDKETIKKMLEVAKSVTVLDHHKTALPLIELMTERKDMICQKSKFHAIIDMTRSGCQIAWDYVNPLTPERPWFLNDIADRDLWTWKVKGSKEVGRSLFGMGYYKDFETFDKIQYLDRMELFYSGEILLRDDEQRMKAICRRAINCTFTVKKYDSLLNIENHNFMHLTGNDTVWERPLHTSSSTTYKVKVVECEHSMASDVGNMLCNDSDECDFAVMFRYDMIKDEWFCSARSKNVDLTSIVKLIDPAGGGHPKASGFTIRSGETIRKFFIPVSP